MDAAEFKTHTEYVWLAAGVVLVAADALGLTGLGLMFAGLGAAMTGTAILLGVVDAAAHVQQGIIFFAATALWAALLWKPMQRLRVGNKHSEYNNIVGETAYVGSNGIDKRNGGEVTWSGTIMKAQLAKNVQVDRIEAGSQVTIVEVSGATLFVKPRD